MADERKDSPRADSAMAKPAGATHAGPTIDLDASQVTDKTQAASSGSDAGASSEADASAPPTRRSGSALLAGLAGGVTALAAAAALWLGLDGMSTSPPPITAAQFTSMSANVDALTARLAKAEATATRPVPAVDASLSRRAEAAEASLTTLRDEMSAMKSQLAAAGTSLSELKTAAPANSSMPDIAALDARLAQVERSMQALQGEVSKRQSPATEDFNARRLAVASALDMAVSRGEPFGPQLAAAKQIAANPSALAALDAFAAGGIQADAIYLRRIVSVLESVDRNEKPAAPAVSAADTGVFDRLQAGLASLVRVERSDAPAASPQRASARLQVSRTDDLSSVRRDVAALPQAGQPGIQAWLKSVEDRDAALAASRAFANGALAALTKSGQ